MGDIDTKFRESTVNAMKEKFEMPRLDIIKLADEDVITESNLGEWDIGKHSVNSGIGVFAKIDDRDDE